MIAVNYTEFLKSFHNTSSDLPIIEVQEAIYPYQESKTCSSYLQSGSYVHSYKSIEMLNNAPER